MTPLHRILPPDPTLCVCGKRDCGIPFGYCHCRCRNKTPLARQRMPDRNLYAGFPLQYINGHNAKKPVGIPEYEPPFLLDNEPCRWLPLSKGYFFIVDDDRYEELLQWRWYAHLEPRSGKVYAVRHDGSDNGVRKAQVALHRHLLPPPPGLTIDHKNGNCFDNRVSNLRPATHHQQVQNRRAHRNGKFPYKGVSMTSFKSSIRYHGAEIYLGCRPLIEEAAMAYDCAARLLFKEFACLNFPEITNYPEWCDAIKVKCLRALASG